MSGQGATAWALPGSVANDADGKPVMVAGRCRSCGHLVFPSPKVCPECWCEVIDDTPLPRTGKLYTYTVVHIARKGWPTPYVIAYVDFDNGVRVSTPLDCDPAAPPEMGSPVELTIKEIYHHSDGTPVMSHHFKEIA